MPPLYFQASILPELEPHLEESQVNAGETFEVNTRPRKSVLLLSPVNFLRASAGFYYIATALHGRGYDLEMFAHVPLEMMHETRNFSFPVHSIYEGALGRVPRIRHFAFQRKIKRDYLKECDALIVNFSNPVAYCSFGVDFKRRYPNKPLIHFCPEIWLPGEKTKFSDKALDYYLRHVNTPDLVIDIEPSRAKLRTDRLGLHKPVEVVRNTLPLETLPEFAPPGTLNKLAGRKLPTDKRVLLFTGSATVVMVNELKAILDNVSDRVFLLWFAKGTPEALAKARGALGKDRAHVANSVPRAALLGARWEADAGLIAYSWSAVPTANQKYAAPSKLFEFLSTGLPIVSYGNPSVKSLTEKYGIGICAREETPQALGAAIDELFARGDFSSLRGHVRSVFANELSYESSSKVALERACSLIDHGV